MLNIIVSLLIGLLLGYMGVVYFKSIVIVIFALIVILIGVSAKKLNLASYFAILFTGIGMFVLEGYYPEVYVVISDRIDMFSEALYQFADTFLANRGK